MILINAIYVYQKLCDVKQKEHKFDYNKEPVIDKENKSSDKQEALSRIILLRELDL